MEPRARRLAALRAAMAAAGLDAFLVPRADEHLGEYVPAAAERLAWLSGFTGSAGLAVVLAERAAVFTDGRYTLQLAQETDAALWERRHITEEPPPAWLAAALPAGAACGYDPWLMSEEAVGRFTDAGLRMVPVGVNLIDQVWPDRPAPPASPAVIHDLAQAGLASKDKRASLAGGLAEARIDAAVVTDPASLCWLLNLRGSDVPFTPFLLGFVLLHADGHAELFVDPGKISGAVREWLGNEVTVSPREALPEAIASLAGKRVRVDPAGSPVWFAQTLRAAGATVLAGPDPCLLPKACKNEVEQAGARAAHRRDGVALCRFLHWLETAAGRETELSAAERLLAFRREVEGFRGESFPAISGAGPDGAIIHYRVSPATDRPLGEGEVYLIDSGGQYPDGTTDVTRTVWLGDAVPDASLRERFTRVLQGNIAIATLVFPQGVAGPHLDAFARRALWAIGLDYDHGTGHGVGSFLSVHEGPAGLSRAARPVAFAEGMIISNEPGFYLPGQYGIRLETLLLVQAARIEGATKPFLRFEVLTLAPFDRRLIEISLLSVAERAWIDAYHARVLADIGPLLHGDDRAWLERSCRTL